MAFIVGLTGGIGSGKSTVAEMFAKLGARVIDADAIAHELTAAGKPALVAIIKRFGKEYLRSDGQLDRARLRNLVFSDRQAKSDLEAILHPLIRREIETRVAENDGLYAVIVVPLLFETGAYADLVNRTLVIDCEEELQISRACQRSKLSADEVKKIIASQLDRVERQRRADDVIQNNADLPGLEKQVQLLHQRYLASNLSLAPRTVEKAG